VRKLAEEKTIRYERVADFMALFTEEEKSQWRGLENAAPDWIVQGILWFMDQDPAHRRLMEMLAEDE
jgi:hypothetical protein